MFKTVGPILFICKCDTKYFAHQPNRPPPSPLPKRFIRPCDVIGAFSGGHKAIFRLARHRQIDGVNHDAFSLEYM